MRSRDTQASDNDSSDEDGMQNVQPALEPTDDLKVQMDMHDCSCDESDILTEQEAGLGLGDELRLWVNRNRISQTATQQLLKILIPHHPELPRHQRTLLRTATDIDLKNVAGGDYSYLSLRRVLPGAIRKAGLTTQDLQECNNQLNIQFNVDGVPVFNSVNYSIWPILGSLVSPVKSDVFTVAVYGGNSKPDDFNAFMQPLVDELQQIDADVGFPVEHLGVKVEVAVENFCCDAPAKADVRLVKQFNARQGCERCNVSGTYMQHRMVFRRHFERSRRDFSTEQVPASYRNLPE